MCTCDKLVHLHLPDEAAAGSDVIVIFEVVARDVLDEGDHVWDVRAD